jgi:homospermidine synthase
MLLFPNRILFVGFGAVARCTLPILLKHIDADPQRITIMDFEPNEVALKPWIEQGVTNPVQHHPPTNLRFKQLNLLLTYCWQKHSTMFSKTSVVLNLNCGALDNVLGGRDDDA